MTKEGVEIKASTYAHSVSKRIFDLLVSSLLLIIALPVIVAVSLAIIVTSGRPVLYSQLRFGKNKKPFLMYKFRTMVNNAEALQEDLANKNIAPKPMFKIVKDPRFTQIGYFLSQSGLDEFPQLLNVLKGEMSLVGPRPLPVDEAQKLLAIDPRWAWRHSVKPGLFSYWVLSSKKYESLKSWKNLEKKTLQVQNYFEDIKIINVTILRQLRSIVRNFQSP